MRNKINIITSLISMWINLYLFIIASLRIISINVIIIIIWDLRKFFAINIIKDVKFFAIKINLNFYCYSLIAFLIIIELIIIIITKKTFSNQFKKNISTSKFFNLNKSNVSRMWKLYKISINIKLIILYFVKLLNKINIR